MLTYRCYIYKVAIAVTSDATTLAVSLSSCVSRSHLPGYRERLEAEIPTLQAEAARLRSSVDKLLSALPSDVSDSIQAGHTNLKRHLYFIDLWLGRSQPGSCLQDPIDISKLDLPEVLALFDDWYERCSPTSAELPNRLAPFMATGQLNAALRETWAIFKSQMVNLFGVSDELDGHRLVDKLFSSNGPTAAILDNRDRLAHANLLKGLYTLYRNPIMHNDAAVNPESTDAVLALINAVLSDVEALAQGQSDSAPTETSRR